MKITVPRDNLLNAVSIANTFMPIEGEFNGKIVMVGVNGKIEVKSTDMIQSIILKDITFISSDLTVDNFTAFSIDGKKLLTVLKAAKTEELTLHILDSRIEVKSGRSTVKIDILAETQDVTISNGSGSNFDISENIANFEQVIHAVGNKNPKHELNGILLQIKDGIFNVVGTDTRRLSCITTNTNLPDKEVIVPKDGINTIVKLFKGFTISAEIDDTTLAVHTENISYQTKLINGKYPNWESIVPKSVKQAVTINRYSLSSMLQEAKLFDDNVIIKIKNGEIQLKDINGETNIVDLFTDENTNLVFTINAKNVLEFLSSFQEDELQIGFNGTNLPVIFKANNNYREIVMPVVMQEDVEEMEDEKQAA
ncbi:DNA polymerase III subunit beta [Sulfurimonas sp.]|uniref:DNA polymerase III subunit beta n=1 Tax=Sulfurimonas sp. TaxID=2022749 RepID=UPI0025EFAB26|nr:DNA polymerase III subunit beta [Sulfurimonas sp.]